MIGEKDTKPCANCGQLLTRLVSQYRGKHWYCSNRCQAAHSPAPITMSRIPNPTRGQRATHPCTICGATVTRYLSQQRKEQQGWTCSRRCLGKYSTARQIAAGTWKRPVKPRRGTVTPCEMCQKPIYQAPRERRRYCSRRCSNAGLTRQPVLKQCRRCKTAMTLKPSQAAREWCSKRCETTDRIKRPLERLHNGRPALKNRHGYIYVWEPSHPCCNRAGWIAEHRLVMELQLGRVLTSEDQVDHINRVRDDNRPENLQVLTGLAHAAKTAADLRGDRSMLAEYRRRFGPL